MVKEVAAKLAAAGIDPWVDEWEIRSGEDFVAAINRGLAQCDAGLVFLSHETADGKWAQAEISALTVQAIEDGKPLIPILIDPDVPIPALLRARSRLGVEQTDELIDAIYGRMGKPRVAAPRAAAVCRHFTVRLRKMGSEEIEAAAELDGQAVGKKEPRRLGVGFHYSYAAFLRSRPQGSRQVSAREAAADYERDLRHLGRMVGEVVFPGSIGAELRKLLDQAAAAGEEVRLTVETGDAGLLGIPFEAASLEDGRVPSLEPGVTMTRRLSGGAARMPEPRPGPLKILVAVGAPDEGKTPNAVLDVERELHTILNAIQAA